MFKLPKSASAFGSSTFEKIFKEEVEQLNTKLLPLQQGLSSGGYALYDSFKVMVISTSQQNNKLQIKAGIFYHGVIAGCSCADDPSPTDVTTEYCEVLFEVDRETGEGSVALVGE